jgi:hypothetical protein
MHFGHAPEIWSDYPELVAGVIAAHGIDRSCVAKTTIGIPK